MLFYLVQIVKISSINNINHTENRTSDCVMRKSKYCSSNWGTRQALSSQTHKDRDLINKCFQSTTISFAHWILCITTFLEAGAWYKVITQWTSRGINWILLDVILRRFKLETLKRTTFCCANENMKWLIFRWLGHLHDYYYYLEMTLRVFWMEQIRVNHKIQNAEIKALRNSIFCIKLVGNHDF